MRVLICRRLPEEIVGGLKQLGLEPVGLPPCERLDWPVADHPDMLLYLRRDGALVTWGEYYRQNRAMFDRLGREVLLEEKLPSRSYPGDVALNALRMCSTVFGRTDVLSSAVLADGEEIVAVRQGYAHCSVLAPDSDHAITADSSLAAALEQAGKTVVRISPGNILLPGYGYGFIGGSTVVCGKRVLFFGTLTDHPDREKICSTLEKWGFVPTELGKCRLTDWGGGVIL